MPVCRLCAEEKSSDEIAIRLLDKCRILLFQDLVEYYTRVSLDKSPSLPQDVCKKCHKIIADFSKFSYLMEEHQKRFSTSESADNVNQEISKESSEEPQLKKIKLENDMNTDEQSTIEPSTKNETIPEVTHETSSKPPLRQRRKSVAFTESINCLLAKENVSNHY